MSSVDVVQSVVSTIMFFAAGYRGRELIHPPRSPFLISLVVTLIAFGIMFAVQVRIVRDMEDSILVNMGQLLGNSFALIAALAATAMVSFIVEDDVAAARSAVRVRSIVLALTLAAMVMLFALNPTDSLGFQSLTAPVGIIAYYVIYVSYIGFALAGLLKLTLPYARQTSDPYLRVGLRFVVLGCIVGLTYCISRAAILILGRFVENLPSPQAITLVVTGILPITSVLMIVLGVTLRRWAPFAARPVIAARRTHGYIRSYRRLEPLQRAVNAVLPELAFAPRDGVRRPRLRLYGRIVELQDAEFVLAPYIGPDLPRQMREYAITTDVRAEDVDSAVLAAIFVVGLQAIRDDDVVVGSPVSTAAAVRLSELDLARETRRFERVSELFAHSTLVPGMVSQALSARSLSPTSPQPRYDH